MAPAGRPGDRCVPQHRAKHLDGGRRLRGLPRLGGRGGDFRAAGPIRVGPADREGCLARGAAQRVVAHRRLGPGVDADAADQPHRGRDFEVSAVYLRQHDPGRVRPDHRGAGAVVVPQPQGQRAAAAAAGHVVGRFRVRTHPRSDHPRCAAGTSLRPIQRLGQPGLRKQPGGADHQHLRRGAVRAGPVHLPGHHPSGSFASSAASAATPASATG
ncbi:hypothetical protein MYIN104542_29225 [Mycobacterium intermedium]